MTQIINGPVMAGNFKKGRRVNLKAINLGLGVVITVCSLLYLFNISDLTVKGFALRELKARANSLASEKMANEEKVNSLQSYYSLNSRTKVLNMVAVGNIEYLTVASPVVAKK